MLSCFTRNDSSNDTMTHSHENETLDEPISTTKKPSKSMPMPLAPRGYAELRALSELDFSIGYTGGWSLLIVLGNTMRTEIERSVQFSHFVFQES